MTSPESKEIRGVTYKIAFWVIVGSLSVCSSIIWGVSRMETANYLVAYQVIAPL